MLTLDSFVYVCISSLNIRLMLDFGQFLELLDKYLYKSKVVVFLNGVRLNSLFFILL